MTVKELIEQLRRYPETVTVHVRDTWSNWANIRTIEENGPKDKLTAIRLDWRKPL